MRVKTHTTMVDDSSEIVNSPSTYNIQRRRSHQEGSSLMGTPVPGSPLLTNVSLSSSYYYYSTFCICIGSPVLELRSDRPVY